jgi:hypothetical protein
MARTFDWLRVVMRAFLISACVMLIALPAVAHDSLTDLPPDKHELKLDLPFRPTEKFISQNGTMYLYGGKFRAPGGGSMIPVKQLPDYSTVAKALGYGLYKQDYECGKVVNVVTVQPYEGLSYFWVRCANGDKYDMRDTGKQSEDGTYTIYAVLRVD